MRQDAHYVFLFFLESRNQVFAFVKSLPECDSLICCCIDTGKTVKQYCHGNEDLRLFPRSSRYFLNLDLYFSMNKDSNK
jgi:hypothetical protein